MCSGLFSQFIDMLLHQNIAWSDLDIALPMDSQRSVGPAGWLSARDEGRRVLDLIMIIFIIRVLSPGMLRVVLGGESVGTVANRKRPSGGDGARHRSDRHRPYRTEPFFSPSKPLHSHVRVAVDTNPASTSLETASPPRFLLVKTATHQAYL